MMYEPGNPVYEWHVKNFGHPSVFGYKDILNRYNPAHFDAAQADKLVPMYKGAGAKFFVAMGVHHDNFDMWDSKYQPRWNAQAITGKDIVGLWHDASVKNGLRFGVSSHAARSYRRFQTSHGADAGGHFDGQDPAYTDLCGTPWKSADPKANEVVDYLIDLVSKNGVLCLNIPLTPDGTLEPESETLLKEMGRCFNVIGEAVFGTRPWTIAGEGPTAMTDFAVGTAKDIRFTRNKANNVLYATVLDWPGNGATLTIGSLTSARIDAGDISSITMLGSPEKITWKQDAKGLHVAMPMEAPKSLHAFSLKITVKTSLHAERRRRH